VRGEDCSSNNICRLTLFLTASPCGFDPDTHCFLAVAAKGLAPPGRRGALRWASQGRSQPFVSKQILGPKSSPYPPSVAINQLVATSEPSVPLQTRSWFTFKSQAQHKFTGGRRKSTPTDTSPPQETLPWDTVNKAAAAGEPGAVTPLPPAALPRGLGTPPPATAHPRH